MKNKQIHEEVQKFVLLVKGNIEKEVTGSGSVTALRSENGRLYLEIKKIYIKYHPKAEGWLEFLEGEIPYLHRTTVDRHIRLHKHGGLESHPGVEVLGTSRILKMIKIWGKDDNTFKASEFLESQGINIPSNEAPWSEKQAFIQKVDDAIKKERQASHHKHSASLNDKIDGILAYLNKKDTQQPEEELDRAMVEDLIERLKALIMKPAYQEQSI